MNKFRARKEKAKGQFVTYVLPHKLSELQYKKERQKWEEYTIEHKKNIKKKLKYCETVYMSDNKLKA